MAKVVEAIDSHAAWSVMRPRTALNVFLYGLIVGAVTYLLFLLLDRLVFQMILCQQGMVTARCDTSSGYASGVSIILGSIVGLVLLVRERIYRPILAIIGVCVSLWTIFAIVASLPLLVALVIISVIFGLSYLLFSWLVQPTSLFVSLAGVIIVSTLARLGISL